MKRFRFSSIVRPVVLLSCMAGASLVYAQPSVSSVYPDGSMLFQYTSNLTFNATASVGISNINVQLTGSRLTGESSIRVFSLGSGVTVNGTTMSIPLASNWLYSAAITVTDSNGATTSVIKSFDTLKPAFTWEAEDYDYNSGQFIDNPQTNAYAGLVASDQDSYHTETGGGNTYRDYTYGLGNEAASDTPRAQYSGTGKTDYDIGWNNAGNWANYTRHYPAGTYNIYVRASNVNTSPTTDNMELTGAVDGRFNIPYTGDYQKYSFVPLVDSDGNLVEFTTDGSALMLTEKTISAGYNFNFFMLMPVLTAGQPDASIDNLYPDGAYQFESTNKLAFNINSTLGVSASDVLVQLLSTNLTGTTSSTVLSSGNGLTISGSATALTVSAKLTSNLLYSVFIQVVDANGVTSSKRVNFDTIKPSYVWQAEDWDYSGGAYFVGDSYFPSCYAGVDGLDGVDFLRTNPSSGGNSYGRAGLSTENCGDTPMLEFEGYDNYDVGYNAAGNWANYTRDWPAGVFNIYARIANGSAASSAEGMFSLVSSGLGTAEQTTIKMGTYASPLTAGWQVYNWQPVRDSGGNLIRFTGGTTQTLRHTDMGAGNNNQNMFILMPADLSIHNLPFVSDTVPDGSAMFNFTNVFAFTANSSIGIDTNGIAVTIDGVKTSRITFKGAANVWNVTCPISKNGLHAVTVVLTDSYGSTTNSYSFTTFDPDKTYFVEAEDYDYDGGQFIDNPGANAYSGLASVDNVDTYTTSGNFDGTHVPYRSTGLNQESATDAFKNPNHSSSDVNYDLGYVSAGNWGNYTRIYPAGVYNIYLRAANGNTSSSSGGTMDVVTSGIGTTSQTTTNLGTFDSIPATGGWQVYTWTPLKDSKGNLVQFTGGSQTTLRYVQGGGANYDYFVLVPVDVSTPTISGIYPDGTSLFQGTNTLRFTASSTSGISTNDIVVTINGVVWTNVTFTGTSTNWTVLCTKLPADTSYTAVIVFTTASNQSVTKTVVFDTFSSSYYTWEAEDYDYDSGKFFDNPQTNAYAGLIASTNDSYHTETGGSSAYRDYANGLGNEACSDLLRPQYSGTGATDYDVGWNNAGNWANYTRTYPAGTYNIYMRAANPNGAGTDSAEFSGPVTGLFAVPTTGGWQIYTWVPLQDADGNLATFVSDGTVQTIKYSVVGGNLNVNFYMLVPATTTTPTSFKVSAKLAGNTFSASFPTQSGVSYQLVYKTNLSDTTWTAVGSAVTGDGSVKTITDAVDKTTHRFYRVKTISQ